VAIREANGARRIRTLSRGGQGGRTLAPNDIRDVEFAADGRVVASNGDGTLTVLDTRSGAVATLRGNRPDAGDLVVAPGGHEVASAGRDGTIRLWDVDRALPRILTGPHGAAVAAVDPGGRILAGAGETGRISVWDLRRPRSLPIRLLNASRRAIQDLALNGPGDLIASSGADGDVRIWDWRRARTVRLVVVDRTRFYAQNYHAVALSRDGRLVAASGRYPVRVWPVSGGHFSRRFPPTDRAFGAAADAYSLAFSVDGTRFAEATGSGTIFVWTLARREPRPVGGRSRDRRGPRPERGRAPGRRLLRGWQCRVWDLASRRSLANLSGHQGPAYTVRFSPDGRLLVSAGADGTARVWDWRAGTALLVLHGGRGALNTAGFAEGGRQVVAAGEDGTIRIWPCDVCGPIGEVVALARRRAVRSLSAEERSQFLLG